MHQLTAELAATRQQIDDLVGRVIGMGTAQTEMQEQTATLQQELRAARTGGGGGQSALVSKWAPDSFSGEEEAWRQWSMKFRSYVGAMNGGIVGTWMDHAAQHRDTNLATSTLDPGAQQPATLLYSALVAT